MKKFILSLILLFNLFCVFATGLKNVYWGMPYNKLLMEKQVIEDKGEITVLLENTYTEDIIYFFSKDNSLTSILICTNKTRKYIKDKQKKILFSDDKVYSKEFFINYIYKDGGKRGNNKYIPYLPLMLECFNYLFSTTGSGYFNDLKEKNIQKTDAKSSVTIYQSTPATKVFVFENVIENENFIILLPSKE